MSAPPPPSGPLLTLEPLIDAVRDGVTSAGWTLSGLQKTTSYDFEGRWAGDSTRSAYLFFHPADERLPVSVDVYLDETSRGLTGNLALAVDLPPLSSLGDVRRTLERLAATARDGLSDDGRRPLTLRLRLADAARPVERAEVEARFKLVFPARVIESGAPGVARFSADAVRAFERLLQREELRGMVGGG